MFNQNKYILSRCANSSHKHHLKCNDGERMDDRVRSIYSEIVFTKTFRTIRCGQRSQVVEFWKRYLPITAENFAVDASQRAL